MYYNKLAAIAEERTARRAKREGIVAFLAELEYGPLAEFDEGLWYATVESVVVGKGGVTVKWRDGRESVQPTISPCKLPENAV